MSDAILIMGAGHQGLAMATHLALNGVNVNLWNRTYENITTIAETRLIHSSGVVNGIAKINNVSSSVEELMADTIMVTTPAFAHKPIANLLAPYVTNNSVIILNPGRTFGVEEFQYELAQSGCKFNPIIAETQTIVYTCRRDKENSVKIYALKNGVEIATSHKHHLDDVFSRIPLCLRSYFKPVDSTAITSIGNVGMILHCAPVLMNIGWIESSIADFKYYYDGISPSIAAFLEKADNERLSVGEAMGYKLESTANWLRRIYSVNGSNLYECIRNNESYNDIYAPTSLKHRYLEEDIPYGLVPIESVAMHYGITTPCITTVIDLACLVMETDYREHGRKYIMEVGAGTV